MRFPIPWLLLGVILGWSLHHRTRTWPAPPSGAQDNDSVLSTHDSREVPSLSPWRETVHWLESASWENIASRLESMESSIASIEYRLCLTRMVELDPVRTWQSCQATVCRDHSLAVWMQCYSEEALEFALGIEDHETLVDRALAYASETDLLQWLPLFERYQLELPEKNAQRRLTAFLARRDPESAANRAVETDALLEPIMLAWSAQDAEAALAWTDRQEEHVQDEALAALVRHLPTLDASRAFALLQPRLEEWPSHLEELIANLADVEYDLVSLIPVIEENFESPALKNRLRLKIYEELAKGDPATLARLWPRLALSNEATIRLGQKLLKVWVKTDPTAAQQWVLSTTSGEVQSQLLVQYGAALSSRDPAKLRKLLDEESVRHPILRDHEPLWLGFDDASEAIDWLAHYPVHARGEALKTLVESKVAPEVVAGILSKVKSGETRQHLSRRLMNRWARTHPIDAIQWSSDHAEPSERGMLISAVIEQWGRDRLHEACQWAEANLPNDPIYSNAWMHLAYHLMDDDPTQALRMAARVPSGNDSRIAFGDILSEMDPQSALAELPTLPLPPESWEHWTSHLQEQAAIKAYLTQSR